MKCETCHRETLEGCDGQGTMTHKAESGGAKVFSACPHYSAYLQEIWKLKQAQGPFKWKDAPRGSAAGNGANYDLVSVGIEGNPYAIIRLPNGKLTKKRKELFIGFSILNDEGTGFDMWSIDGYKLED